MRNFWLSFISLTCIFVVFYAFYILYTVPHHIPRRESGPAAINGVPLVIYQSWGSHLVPKDMKKTVLHVAETNPEFDYYLYSDEESRAFIKENYDADVVSAFDSLRPGAYKSDLWRYCILYKRGGVYFDIKMVPLLPISDILKNHSVVFVKDFTHGYGQKPMRDCVWNGLMISPPKNEIFKHCINEIVESCKSRLYRNNPLDITGPCLLGRMIKKYSGADFFKDMVLNLHRDEGHGNLLLYHNIPYFIVEYPTYRKEQRAFQKSPYYATLYKEHKVYHE